MKILIVSLFLPQAKAYHAGGRYVYEVIREMSRRHEISLVTRAEEGEEGELGDLNQLCSEVRTYSYRSSDRRSLFGTLGLVFNYIGFSRYADRMIRDGRFDVVMVEWVETALFIRKGGTPMILDAHDVITKPAARVAVQGGGMRRIQAFLRFLVIRRLEMAIAGRFDHIFTRSDFDRDYLTTLMPGVEATTIPHPAGLDISAKGCEPQGNSILFLASYRYRKVNVDAALWFYNQVFPLVRREIPDARFIVAGYGPPEELTSLAARDPQVEVTGFVDDIDRCYKEAAVFVAPILTGGGIIVKVLDALAAGRPVVSTTYGNEGIGAVPGRDLIVADDPESFAQGVVRFLKEPELARRMAESGREFVGKYYSLESVIGRIEGVCREVAKRKV